MKKIALHVCCGPCALEPYRLLKEEGFEPVIFWTNPNIQPLEEHKLRFDTMKKWADDNGIQVVVCADDRSAWDRDVAPYKDAGDERCRHCYRLRLQETCRVASEAGFEYVTTSLAVSPYQLLNICNAELEAAACDYNLTPVVRDWREHYKDATRISRELGMYRQKYCGCLFSKAEVEAERLEAKERRKREKELKRIARLKEGINN